MTFSAPRSSNPFPRARTKRAFVHPPPRKSYWPGRLGLVNHRSHLINRRGWRGERFGPATRREEGAFPRRDCNRRSTTWPGQRSAVFAAANICEMASRGLHKLCDLGVRPPIISFQSNQIKPPMRATLSTRKARFPRRCGARRSGAEPRRPRQRWPLGWLGLRCFLAESYV